jgi:hypothetical protein
MKPMSALGQIFLGAQNLPQRVFGKWRRLTETVFMSAASVHQLLRFNYDDGPVTGTVLFEIVMNIGQESPFDYLDG